MLKVFYTRVSDFPMESEGLALSEYRLRKLSKLIVPIKRQQGIVTEMLLAHALKTVFPDIRLPLRIDVSELGKPVLADKLLHFSLSHSGDFAACVLSDREVGIDIETKAVYKSDLAERFFNAEDKIMIDSSINKDEMFSYLWTAKESALKYIGTGLARSLSDIIVMSGDKLCVAPENIILSVYHFYKDGVHLSVCTENMEYPEIIFVDRIK